MQRDLFLNRNCPFCGSTVSVTRGPSRKRIDAGIVDLCVQCSCGGRIEASGIGEQEAQRDLTRRIEARKGTTVEDWLKREPTDRRRRWTR